METYVFEPPEPITTYWYQCNNEFFLEPLEYMIEERETYGLAVIDRKEATIATLRGKKSKHFKPFDKVVFRENTKQEVNHKERFDRVIDLAAHEFKKRIGEHMNEDFLALEELEGVIIGGPGFTKKNL